MIKTAFTVIILAAFTPFAAKAMSVLEGSWRTQDGSKLVQINEFNGTVTLGTSSFYANGAQVNWFFAYDLPKGRDIKAGETIKGTVRSVDGYYNCVFDEKAEAKLEANGVFKVHYPLLTYHLEERAARDGNGGYYNQRTVDWTRWGWAETNYGFPIERYRVISSDCIIDQRNWVVEPLTRTNSPF